MVDKIGKFEVIELLGRGAMGVVYKGHDPSLARHVAIKVMTTHLEMDPELRARFFREAQAAGSLQHPNVITIFELGESNGQPFIAMEYVPGRDLDDIIGAREPLTIVEKVDLIEQVCRGLAFAHERRIIHRDIKPANVRVTEMGQVKVMDFGVAHLISSDLTATGSLVGTPYYMAPEVINGEPVDARADIFSVGATFYELLTYTRPFQADNLQSVFRKILHDDPAPLRELGYDVPPVIQQVLDRSLAKRPRDRYADTGDFLKDLMQFWETLPAPAQARAAATTALGNAAAKAAKAARRRWTWKRMIPLAAGAAIGMAGLLIVGGALFGTLFFRPSQPDALATRPAEQAANPETALAGNGEGAGAGMGPAGIPVDSLVRQAEDAESTADESATDSPPASEEVREEEPAQRREVVERARPSAPDPTALARTRYESAAEVTESERTRARELGAPQLAPTDYGSGESLREDAIRAADAGRYAEAQRDMERARSALAEAATAAVIAWREKLDSARSALEPLKAEADESAAEYEQAEQLRQQATGAQGQGRYREALEHLTRAAEAYALAVAEVEEPAAEADPVPERPAGEIAGSVLDELRRAVESEDLAAVQRVWVSLTRSEVRGFGKFFELARDLRASYDIESLERSSDRIIIRVGTNYDYVNENTRRRVRQSITQYFEMAPREDRWVIVASRGA